MALEGAYSVADDMARQLLCFGRRIGTEEIVSKIEAVDVEAVRRVGRRLFTGGEPTLTVLGPARDIPPLRWLGVGTG
jgi:predicted Zn-dependent peptidase